MVEYEDEGLDLTEHEIRIKDLEKENAYMREALSNLTNLCIESGLEEELKEFDIRVKSAEETICIDGINHLLKLFKLGNFTKDDTIMFDTLYKNLRLIKGQVVSNQGKRKEKPADIKELLKIVEGNG